MNTTNKNVYGKALKRSNQLGYFTDVQSADTEEEMERSRIIRREKRRKRKESSSFDEGLKIEPTKFLAKNSMITVNIITASDLY